MLLVGRFSVIVWTRSCKLAFSTLVKLLQIRRQRTNGFDRMSADTSGNLTQLLSQVAAGDQQANSQLCELVYHDLRSIADQLMRGERANHTLQPTALVNEALLRLFDANLLAKAPNRSYFFAAATRAMRRVLIEHARR